MADRKLRACLVGTTALSVVLSGPLNAQELNTTPLGRIILGWGTEQVALDTPQATTVIDQTEIEQQQATTVGELFDQVPGVEAIGSERVLGQTFNIRGFGEVPAGDEGRVILQQDGATKYYEQYRIGAFFADPTAFCNVEVLRGPASATLYGGGAIGGVIRFDTCRASDYLEPGDDSQLRFQLGVESNGLGGNAAMRYARMPSSNVELLFGLTYRGAEDFEDGNGDEVAGSSFTAASALFNGTYHLDDSRSITGTLEYWNSNLNDTEYEQTGASGFFGTVDRHTIDTTATLKYESAGAYGDLEVTLSYSDTDVEQTDSSNEGAFGGSELFFASEYGYQTISLDGRITKNTEWLGNNTTLIYGATYTRQNRTAESVVVSEIDFHPEGTSDRFAIFGQAEIEVNDRLTLVPGLRLEYSVNEPSAENADTQETTELLGVSPKLAFTYDASERVGFFGSIAQTQRAPTLDELYSYDASDGETAATDLDAETARSIELGVTYSDTGIFNPDDAFDLRLTGFYNRVEDLIERDSTAGTPYYRNIAEAEIYGVELEAAYEAERGFVRANFSDIRGKDLTTNEVWSNLPQRNLALTIGGRSPERNLEYGWRANFYDDIDYGGGTTFGGYQVHDVFVDWRPESGVLDGTEIRFGVDNIFDKAYQNSLDDELGRGRTFRLTAVRVF